RPEPVGYTHDEHRRLPPLPWNGRTNSDEATDGGAAQGQIRPSRPSLSAAQSGGRQVYPVHLRAVLDHVHHRLQLLRLPGAQAHRDPAQLLIVVDVQPLDPAPGLLDRAQERTERAVSPLVLDLQ